MGHSSDCTVRNLLAKFGKLGYSLNWMKRRNYNLTLTINGRLIREVIIDPHYEEKHSDINDLIILELVQKLDRREFRPEEREGDWEFFMVDNLEHEGKLHRLVWCMRDYGIFIGVINAFRR